VTELRTRQLANLRKNVDKLAASTGRVYVVVGRPHGCYAVARPDGIIISRTGTPATVTQWVHARASNYEWIEHERKGEPDEPATV
jgi:hypothetical protein